jgi:hypothetical protein
MLEILHLPLIAVQAHKRKQPAEVIAEPNREVHEDMLAENEAERQDDGINRHGQKRNAGEAQLSCGRV